MEDSLTITLTSDLKAELDHFAQAEGISLDNLVSQAIEDYLFIRRFRALRSHLMHKTQTIYTDEDIFVRMKATGVVAKVICRRSA